MTELIDIDVEINSPAGGDDEVMVDVEMLAGNPQEADNSQIGKKRMSNEKPPLPKKAKTCPPKADPNSATGFGGRRRAEVWNHVIDSPRSTPTEPRALCKYCLQEYISASKNGTTSMFTHVSKICPSRANPYTSARFEAVGKELGQKILYDQSQLLPSSFESSKSGVKPLLFTQDTGRSYLTQMIILDELPFDFVEGEGFKRYSYYMQPKFILPSRFTVKRDVMELYKEEKRKLKKLLRVYIPLEALLPPLDQIQLSTANKGLLRLYRVHQIQSQKRFSLHIDYKLKNILR